ncbi:hypothetical protein BJV82DRAFT_79397 [Fennellomyces sp. T-0311]|nr:hypothetical protein BJV82DRAFT_79397 [Fennellomyces sp. T-0311]
MLFKRTTQEFACAEAGKSQVHDTTKELVESSLICPKTIRDMLCKLASPNPSKLHEIVTVEIVTVGFIFTGTKMTCLVMTCPAGNVCRVQRIGPLFFPDSDQNFVSRMKALIRVVWKMRAILKSSLMVVSREDQDFDPDFEHPGFKCPILPSYHHQQRPAKRRKVSKAEINSEATNSHDNQV